MPSNGGVVTAVLAPSGANRTSGRTGGAREENFPGYPVGGSPRTRALPPGMTRGRGG